MKASDIRLNDFWRLLFGDTPPTFLFEVVVRVVLLYAVLVVALRSMGPRMSSQVTRNELLALVSLAAAIGPAVQDPSRGLLPPMLVAALVVLAQRAIALGTFKSHRIDRLVQGEPVALVADGVMSIDAMRKTATPRERLLSALRADGITHLGAVERVYLEPNGAFTVLKRARPAPGLSVVPEFDEALHAEQPRETGCFVCSLCGAIRAAHTADGSCDRCGTDNWTPAIRP